MSLGTPWGLIRHYWVLIALVLTVVSLIVLISHMLAVSAAAALTRTATISPWPSSAVTSSTLLSDLWC